MTRETRLALRRLRAQPRYALAVAFALVLVLRGTIGASGNGVAVGLAGALVLMRFLEGLLSGVSPFDPPTYALLTLVLLTVAAGAASLPALRAARVDPTEVLRHE